MSLKKSLSNSSFIQSSSGKCNNLSSPKGLGRIISCKQNPNTCGSLHRLKSPPRPSTTGNAENNVYISPSKPSTPKSLTSFLSKNRLRKVNFSKMTNFLPVERCRLSLLYRPNDELLLEEITKDSWLKSSLLCHGLLPLDDLKK